VQGPLPTLTPTVLITFFFGLFGLIPAIRGANAAQRAGRPGSRYWVAFGATMAASAAVWVLAVVVLTTVVLGAAVRSADQASAASAAAAAPTGATATEARVEAIVTAHPREVGVLLAIDPASGAALSRNPNDPQAVAAVLGEVAREQGADDSTVQGVQSVVTGGQVAAVEAIDPTTLAALERNPTDQAAGARAVTEVASKAGVPPSRAVQLLASLGTPGVLQHLQDAQRYSQVLVQANQAVPASQLSYLGAHRAEAEAVLARTPH
jgi:hypothetical protein